MGKVELCVVSILSQAMTVEAVVIGDVLVIVDLTLGSRGAPPRLLDLVGDETVGRPPLVRHCWLKDGQRRRNGFIYGRPRLWARAARWLAIVETCGGDPVSREGEGCRFRSNRQF